MRQNSEPPPPGKRADSIADLNNSELIFDIREITDEGIPQAAKERITPMRLDRQKRERSTRCFTTEVKDKSNAPVETYIVWDADTEPSSARTVHLLSLANMVGGQLAGQAKFIYDPNALIETQSTDPTVAATYTEGEEQDPVNFRNRVIYSINLRLMDAFARSIFGRPVLFGTENDLTRDAELVIARWEAAGKVLRIRTDRGE